MERRMENQVEPESMKLFIGIPKYRLIVELKHNARRQMQTVTPEQRPRRPEQEHILSKRRLQCNRMKPQDNTNVVVSQN